jgi:PilZ domain
MIYGFEHSDDEELASLAKEIRVRVLNCSGNGCLLESDAAIPVGTVARLRIAFGGQEFDDTVRVVRCQALVGAGSIYHVGTQFLSTTPPYAGTLRHLMRRELNRLAGWLRAKEPR